ncbi:MAG: arabinose-5-phosphate isomerase [Campylobacterota bacterium]|nr:arabinose-5-phosphate isomerase [Campylobacterota bacterium]
MNYIETAKEVLKIEAAELLGCAEKINNEWNRAIELLDKTEGKVIVMGVGKSGLVGSKIAATFASTGTPSFFIHPTEAMHGDLGMISKGDLVIAISNSGESQELISILPHIKRFNIKIIGMSAKKNSTLAKFSDELIDISISKEACPLGIAPTSSTTLTMALGDALAVTLMKKRGFKKEDFASFHPGGSLGKKLFVKAIDLARKTDLPQLGVDATIKEAITVMTNGKLGTVLLLENDKVAAILSDGDLRRALLDKDFSLEKKAIDYATKNPKTESSKDLLASEALAIIESKKIQLLILTDSNGKLEGVLHIHALVEAGIS